MEYIQKAAMAWIGWNIAPLLLIFVMIGGAIIVGLISDWRHNKRAKANRGVK